MNSGCLASMLAIIDPETLIRADHPLRTIQRFADAALRELSPLFDEMYSADGQGRASIPPERLLKASLLISLYSVRVSREFFDAVVLQADRLHLLRDEHFSVDGTLIEALMENRHGLLVDFQVTTATGTAERDELPQLIDDARMKDTLRWPGTRPLRRLSGSRRVQPRAPGASDQPADPGMRCSHKTRRHEAVLQPAHRHNTADDSPHRFVIHRQIDPSSTPC